MKNHEKIALLEEEHNNAKKTDHLNLKGHFKFIHMLSQANALETATKPLLIAFTIAFEGITNPKNSAHLFSQDLEKLIDNTAKGLQKIAFPDKGEPEIELLKVMLLGILTSALGLTWAAYNLRKPTTDVIKDSKPLVAELLLRFMTKGEVVTTLFRELASAIDADRDILSSSLEALFLLMAVFSFSREGEDFNELLIGLKEPLMTNITRLEEALQSALSQGWITQEESRMSETYIKQVKLAISQSQYETLFKTTQGVLHSLGISLNALLQDLQTIKRVSLTLSQQMGAAKNSVTHVSFAG